MSNQNPIWVDSPVGFKGNPPVGFKGNSPVGYCWIIFFSVIKLTQIDLQRPPPSHTFRLAVAVGNSRPRSLGPTNIPRKIWSRELQLRPQRKTHENASKTWCFVVFCCFNGSYKSWKLVGLFNLSWIPRSSRDSSLKEAGEWCKVHRTSWNKAVTMALVHWASHVEVATASFRNTNVPSLLAHHNHVNRFSRNTIGKYASTAACATACHFSCQVQLMLKKTHW